MYHWTTEKPKEEGWYWYREKRGADEKIYQIINNEDGYLYIALHDHKISLHYVIGEWSSTPIPRPEERK